MRVLSRDTVIPDLSPYITQSSKAGFDVNSRDGRLGLFARRPAAVQATWMDYPGPTGLAQIDYAITDRHHTPPGTEDDYVETVLRLPNDRFCYEPPASAEPVSPAPAIANGYVTFGCFNALYKIGPACITAWATILKAVPGSRLRLLGATALASSFRQRFATHGVDPARIEVLSPAPQPVVMARYGGIDLALDSFPYSGGLTTCEALWMGVPVVTLAGRTHVARVGASLLTHTGLAERIATSPDNYVERAIAAAHDLPRLAELRRTLREHMRASPLCDAPRFTRGLEDAFETMAAK